ncbi:RtcB family protein [Nakamurella lactea]|uniref:RtcB family protein n=1 Tax=Nakamurella lactea TaxID=459515 RepID=UPI0004254D6C|nr:RtcB family protein [Nakamurella lactea]
MQRIGPRLISWASMIDDATLEQAKLTAELDIIHPHLALMPDAHLGKGATVGSVIPTKGAIIPAAVGVDIGCGMRAVRTQFSRSELVARAAAAQPLSTLRTSIERAIPMSMGRHNEEVLPTAEPRIATLEELAGELLPTIQSRSKGWRHQLGSLGSGNHFIEVTADEADRVWLFLHSGSRGIGNQIAQHHIGVARTVNADAGVVLPDPDLAYLTEGTDEFAAYLAELTWAQTFAALNRDEMMERTVSCLSHWMDTEVTVEQDIGCHHNYSASEVHTVNGVDERLWVSRKGAIHAGVGVPGLIPGSMGTASYVVVGKGNADALRSAPHGAGRTYSRNRARKTFSKDDLRAAMVGIEYRDTDAFIDEIPAAYKDIDQVMADAADLVEIRHTLRQLVSVKGD